MSIIRAGNTTTTSVVITGDTTGNLVFTTGGANTVALTLSNTQAATFANNVTITGILTATGGVVQGANAAPTFYAYANNSQTLSSGVFTKIQLNTEVFDTNNNFDSTTNYRFTPTVAGYYQISGNVQLAFSANNGGLCLSVIYKNGAEYSRGALFYSTSSTILSAFASSIASIIYFNGSTDYIEYYVRGDAASGTISTTNATTINIFLSGSLIRSA